MRGVINLPTPGFYIDTAVATEYFEPKDYVVLGGNWNEHAHVEMSPKPDYTYVKWTGIENGSVSKIAVMGEFLYIGVNYVIQTANGSQYRISVTSIQFNDTTIDIYNKTGTIPSTVILDTTAGNATMNDMQICNGALIIIGTYTSPPIIEGLSPSATNGTSGFLYSTNKISSSASHTPFFTSWDNINPVFIECLNFAQAVAVLGHIGDRGLFISSVNAITGLIKYEDSYFDVRVTSVTQSADYVYVFGQFYADIWGLKYSQVNNPTFMIQLNKDWLPSQAVPDMAVDLKFPINDAAVDPLGNVVALGLPTDTDVPTGLIIDMDSNNVALVGQYNFTGLTGASYCPSLIMVNGRIFSVCNFQPTDVPRMVKFNPCTECEPGTYATDNDVECQPCPMGTFSELEGLKSPQECTLCPAGTFNTHTGSNTSIACEMCLPGTYSTTKGATTHDVCINCPRGTYSGTPGASALSFCLKCQQGRTSVEGSAQCSACPRRSTSYDGIVCIACDYGYYLASSTLTCERCPATKFCPVGSITDNLTLPENFNLNNMVPEPDYLDVTRRPLDSAPLKDRYDIWVKVAIAIAGVVAILILIIVVSVLAYSKKETRDKMQLTDLFFPLRHKVEKGHSPVYKPTATGGILSIIALILILVVIANVVFGYINDNVAFTTQLEMKPWKDVPGEYSAVLKFYTFDPNPSNCNGTVGTMGFSGVMGTSFELVDQTTCVVTWTCKENCTTFGYKSGLFFTLQGNGTSAVAIDYNITSPYLWNTIFSLVNGRIFPSNAGQVFRGDNPATIVTRGFFTLYEYLEPYYWLPSPFLKKYNTSGLALSSLSHLGGAVVDANTYTSQQDVIHVNIDLSFDASIITIQAKQRVDFFIFLGSAASVAGTILAILGATFPIWLTFVKKAEKKIDEKIEANIAEKEDCETKPLILNSV